MRRRVDTLSGWERKASGDGFWDPIPIVRIAMQKRVMSWFSPREK